MEIKELKYDLDRTPRDMNKYRKRVYDFVIGDVNAFVMSKVKQHLINKFSTSDTERMNSLIQITDTTRDLLKDLQTYHTGSY